MTIILTLFLVSLAGLTVMVGRKIIFIRSGQVAKTEHFHPFVPDLQKIKSLAYKNIRRYGYLALVTVIRYYVLFSNFIRVRWNELSGIIKKTLIRNKSTKTDGPKEVSTFLKVISEYKHKISVIKHKIKKEEGIK